MDVLILNQRLYDFGVLIEVLQTAHRHGMRRLKRNFYTSLIPLNFVTSNASFVSPAPVSDDICPHAH